MGIELAVSFNYYRIVVKAESDSLTPGFDTIVELSIQRDFGMRLCKIWDALCYFDAFRLDRHN